MYLTCITITQSTIITSLIGFNIGLINVDARLKQRCINVVSTLCNVVSTLRNVVSTLFRRRELTLYQRCATLKIRRRILFHFQRRINVISMLIHNVVSTLIRRWNVGWVLTLYKNSILIIFNHKKHHRNKCICINTKWKSHPQQFLAIKKHHRNKCIWINTK